jgi:hypothetical protein
MQSTVDVEDVLIAIMLVEESVLTVHQRSVLGFQDCPANKRNIDSFGNDVCSSNLFVLIGLDMLLLLGVPQARCELL